MKRVLTILVVAGIVAGAVGLWFLWERYRGVWFAFVKKPPQEITEVLNTTGMPLRLPPEFAISIFAKDLTNPRVLARDPQGTILVSITGEALPAGRQGRVVALPDRNGDGVADQVITVAEGLNRPHGLAVRCRERCELYIAESHQVAVYEYDAETFSVKNKRKIVDLPNGGRHFTRTLLFAPDGRLLISVGSSCDVCHESDSRRAAILVSDADGKGLKTFASGLRNAVFMAIHPLTKKIWVTEMGRDWLGDDAPPDEINIVEEGKHYGWPICYGKNIHDTAFDKNVYIRNPCEEPEQLPSFIDIPAHSSPLGLAFITAEDWPEEFHHNLLVSYHGSWNRSIPTGYKVVRYKLDPEGNPPAGGGEEDFITGWLTPEGVLGRPVDILTEPNGAVYISDDKAGVIYLVRHR